MSKLLPLAALTLLTLSAAGAVRAQDDADAERNVAESATPSAQAAQAAQAAEQRRLLELQSAEIRSREADLRVQERDLEQAAQERVQREAELAEARRQLEEARRELERAARNVAGFVGPTAAANGVVAVTPDAAGQSVIITGTPASPRVARVPIPAAGSNAVEPASLNLVRVLSMASSPWGEMELVPMTPGLARYFGTSEGLLVVRGPEDDAIAIEDGDVILAISGRTPNSPEHAIRILSSFESGETIEFSLMRAGVGETIEYLVPEVATTFDKFDFELLRDLRDLRDPQ